MNLKHCVYPVDIQSSPQCINLAFLYQEVLTKLKKKLFHLYIPNPYFVLQEIRSQISN